MMTARIGAPSSRRNAIEADVNGRAHPTGGDNVAQRRRGTPPFSRPTRPPSAARMAGPHPRSLCRQTARGASARSTRSARTVSSCLPAATRRSPKGDFARFGAPLSKFVITILGDSERFGAILGDSERFQGAILWAGSRQGQALTRRSGPTAIVSRNVCYNIVRRRLAIQRSSSAGTCAIIYGVTSRSNGHRQPERVL
eukprot:1193484-Prorocentrum_minimum.AAC.6